MRRNFLIILAALALLLLARITGAGLVYAAGVLLLGWGVLELAGRLPAQWRLPGALLLLPGVRALSLLLRPAGETGFFAPLSGMTWFNGAVGDFLINALLILLFSSWWRRRLPRGGDAPQPYGAAAALGAVAALLFLHILLIRRLLFAGGLAIDTGNIFRLSFPALLAITAVLVLLLAIYVVAHGLIMQAQRWMPRPNIRLLLIAGVALATLPLCRAVNPGIPPVIVFLIVLIFLVLNDLMVENRFLGLIQLTVWVLLFSAYGAYLFNQNQLDRERLTRRADSQRLGAGRDPLAEAALVELGQALDTPGSLSDDRPAQSAVNRLLARQPYLLRWYRYDFYSKQNGYFLPQKKQPQHEPDTLRPEQWAPVAGNTAFKPDRPYRYTLRLAATDSLVLVWRPALAPPPPGYRAMLPAPPFRQVQGLERYEIALYYRGKLVARTSEGLEGRQPGADLPPPGQFQESLRNDRARLVYHSEEGLVVVLEQYLGDLLQPATLFSFLFLLLSLLTLLLGLINYLLRAFPDEAGFPLSYTPSLRGRLQFSVIGILLGSFLLIGLVTITFIRRDARDNQRRALVRSAELIRRELSATLTADSSQAAAVLARIARRHGRTLDLYRADGRLLASSNQLIYDAGLRPPRIPARALNRLQSRRTDLEVTYERLNGQSFLNLYLPLPVEPRRYLGLPSPPAERQPEDRAFGLLSQILIVYVFLLLLAGVIAIAVARSITHPLTQLGEKLRTLRLGRNEPLEWRGQDEVAQLIAAYNRMINQLEENTEQLKRSEREGAWREMAQQVAHEIKNPLTPMKLSLQHLQRAYEADPGRARDLLRRTGRNLIEQIDGLARIASEFSTFAKLPEARPESVPLNDLLTSTGELFRRQFTRPDALRLQLPEQPLLVRADRTYLQRILNNLLQNARQAVPEDRRPQLELGLRSEGDQVSFWVRDNGAGIPEGLQGRIFEPKFTTKSSGAGLGLAMCKSMVEQMDGRIWFETKADTGTVFWVALPKEKQEFD